MFYMGVKSGYGSPQTLTDQSTYVKKGQKGDLQARQPHLMNVVPVRRFYLNLIFKKYRILFKTILERMHQFVYAKIKESNIILHQFFYFF